MIVSVTNEHIIKGKRNACYSCPIALAILDATGLYFGISMPLSGNRFVAYPETATKAFQAKYLPDEAQQFIGEFDSGQEVKPFEFELDV